MESAELVNRMKAVAEQADTARRIEPGPVRRSSRRRTHKHLATGSGLVVLIAVPAALWLGSTEASSPDTPPIEAAPSAQADPSTPAVMGPGCPPAPPQFTLGADGSARELKGAGVVVSANPGARLELSGVMPDQAPDRAVTRVEIVVGQTRDGDQAPGTEAMSGTGSRLAQVAVEDPGRTFKAELRLPQELPPGRYAVVAFSYWPGPALCGQPNQPGETTKGRSASRIATLKVGEH